MLPRVKKVDYLSEYKLILTFTDKVKKVVNMEPYLKGKFFGPLRDVEYFKTVRINKELRTIEWDNGADMCPDVLHEIGEPLSSGQRAS